MSLFQWIDFQKLGDERGSLVAIEIGMEKAVPFEINRVYYSYDTRSDVRRGLHAHKELKQVAICVSGSCRMVFDDGKNRQEQTLESPERGLLIDKMIWHEMYDFSPDCVLLVLASDHYNEDDYIRSYSEFIKVAKR